MFLKVQAFIYAWISIETDKTNTFRFPPVFFQFSFNFPLVFLWFLGLIEAKTFFLQVLLSFHVCLCLLFLKNKSRQVKKPRNLWIDTHIWGLQTFSQVCRYSLTRIFTFLKSSKVLNYFLSKNGEYFNPRLWGGTHSGGGMSIFFMTVYDVLTLFIMHTTMDAWMLLLLASDILAPNINNL